MSKPMFEVKAQVNLYVETPEAIAGVVKDLNRLVCKFPEPFGNRFSVTIQLVEMYESEQGRPA